jgi:hypothetical protein
MFYELLDAAQNAQGLGLKLTCSHFSNISTHLKDIAPNDLSIFFAPARYRVVKIAHSSSNVVLQTTKNYKAHYSLSWFRPFL